VRLHPARPLTASWDASSIRAFTIPMEAWTASTVRTRVAGAAPRAVALSAEHVWSWRYAWQQAPGVARRRVVAAGARHVLHHTSRRAGKRGHALYSGNGLGARRKGSRALEPRAIGQHMHMHDGHMEMMTASCAVRHRHVLLSAPQYCLGFLLTRLRHDQGSHSGARLLCRRVIVFSGSLVVHGRICYRSRRWRCGRWQAKTGLRALA
jgi:hypothetical protein